MSEGFETTVHHLATLVHGRYLVRVPARDAAGLLVGFHGYGEDAEAHLAALAEIPAAGEWVLVAVQALHPFYRSSTGEVVASWMTRLDRELAIADNVHDVGAVVAEVQERVGLERPLVYEGFSQGVAMAYRAAAAATACDGVCVLAGDLPPELAEAELHLPPVLIGGGKEDARFSPSVLERDAALLEARGVRVATCLFDGAHEWTDEFRRAASEFLKGIAGATAPRRREPPPAPRRRRRAREQ